MFETDWDKISVIACQVNDMIQQDIITSNNGMNEFDVEIEKLARKLIGQELKNGK